jgi:hypothetical protein
MTAMILKAHFRLPPGFLAAFGYPGGRRLVALFWDPCGDEACYDDGQSYACGMSDNWLFLDFIHQRPVHDWLARQGLNLGNSDESATHWLIADAETGDLFAAPSSEASAIVRSQKLPCGESEASGGDRTKGAGG